MCFYQSLTYLVEGLQQYLRLLIMQSFIVLHYPSQALHRPFIGPSQALHTLWAGWILPKKIWYWISDGKNPIPVLDQYIRFINVYYQCPLPRKSSTRQINASFYQAVYCQTCAKILPLLFYHNITRKLPTHFCVKKYMQHPLCHSYVLQFFLSRN